MSARSGGFDTIQFDDTNGALPAATIAGGIEADLIIGGNEADTVPAVTATTSP